MDLSIIIISPRQYGYQTDYLKYVEYLSEKYSVVFLCLDQGEKKFVCDKAEIKYIKLGGKIISYIYFLLYSVLFIAFHSGRIMTANFKGCRFLKKIIFWRKMIVNIRTVSVDKDTDKARLQNERIRKDALPFDRIIMISKGGAEQLKLPMEKVDIVGLGADIISNVPKSYDDLRLLYVGTLNNRDIIKTVRGFRRYINETNDMIATYDIIGDGEELPIIKKYVCDHQLQAQIFVHGRKRYDELSSFFDKCNIGVSFVPITEAYKYQPPTKTYEYMNSGLYTIATCNQVHIDTVSPKSGILIDDSEIDFSYALHLVKDKSIREQDIRHEGVPYLWRTIVMEELVVSIEKIA